MHSLAYEFPIDEREREDVSTAHLSHLKLVQDGRLASII